MREHITDPAHRLEVVTQGGWEKMQWERSLAAMNRQGLWMAHRIDTTELDAGHVADLVALWIRKQLAAPGASHENGPA